MFSYTRISLTPRKTPLLSKKHRDARLKFAKEHIDKPDIKIFGSNSARHVWRKPGQAYNLKCTIPTVKYDCENIMVWGVLVQMELGT